MRSDFEVLGIPRRGPVPFGRGNAARRPLWTPGGRITLSSTLSVPTSDVTAATVLNYLQHAHDLVPRWNGRMWVADSIPDVGVKVSLSGLSNATVYDVFLLWTGGTWVLRFIAWASVSARAVAIERRRGVWVQYRQPQALFVGTIYTSAAGQCEDSAAKRYVWNAYQRVTRALKVVDATNSWTYAVAAWRAWNNSAANAVCMVRGLDLEAVHLVFNAGMGGSIGGDAAIGLGLDGSSPSSSSVYPGDYVGGYTNPRGHATYVGLPGLGYHYLQLLEYGHASIVTFMGDNGSAFQSGGAVGWTMA